MPISRVRKEEGFRVKNRGEETSEASKIKICLWEAYLQKNACSCYNVSSLDIHGQVHSLAIN
ncbi:hypothetical protein M8C21_016204 [Ambrosia artemisiifolia]|uniref:Uncharacterized protein n=1 Tax=Ambrosia artemisiifolia TaxID=4212 RepID=A0AAD5CPL6_AMBAR|nr:hypothetical protein M8C21_016204 [Ambrosia artemisiifolia]